MRTDPNKETSFTESSAWASQRYGFDLLVPQSSSVLRFKANSFSGNESNRFFLQSDGFHDLSFLSGIDHVGDGRGFAVLDYDNDGWQDIALVSTNKPMLQIYRNMMAEMYPNNRSVKLELVGSQKSAHPSKTRSNRDGIGGKVFVTFDNGKTSLIQNQAGEGNVAQNSSLICIGIASGMHIQQIKVVWPTGKTSLLKSTDLDQAATDKTISVVEPE